MPALTPLRSAMRMPATARLSPLLSTRAFRTSQSMRAYKDDQDRESLKPKAHEYTQSGTDDQAAANEDAAFNPNKTSPEAEKQTAGEGSTGGSSNPLQGSPADKDFAEGGQGKAGDGPGGSGKQKGSQKSSGGGSPLKGKKV
ncbi:hypothetical protein AB5N19_07914 [Seiridium cardinale]|uniref:Uncharacterized protein n=1 Tax=Seiridium cardinale TaxID=138064 RepID=A0ABR2Y201_9PEZI